MKKDMKRLLAQAEAAGCRIVPTNGGHVSIYCPDGKTIVTAASTPSDHRSIKNTVALLRRAGVTI